MSDKREKILVAVPSHSTNVSSSIANFFAVCHKMNSHPESTFELTTSTIDGLPSISWVRNEIVKMFLDKDFDRLWMIDDDMILGNDTLDLLKVDGDIVAPLMPGMQTMMDWPTNTFTFSMEYAALIKTDPNDTFSLKKLQIEDKPKGIMDVEGVGTGCTIIKRRVLEDPRMVLETKFTDRFGREFELDPSQPKPIFKQRYLPNGIPESGEDLDFCHRAKQLGYSVKLAADIEIGHMKLVDLRTIFMIKRHFELCGTSVPPGMA